MNIYEKIHAIMQSVQYLSKDDRVKFNSTDYKALSEEKVTTIMREQMIKHKLVVFPIAQTSNRSGQITHVDVVYRMVNAENPEEFIEIASCGDGADSQDKGSGKAMTYAFKYMWLRTFALPTGEDPDKISSAELDDIQAKEKAKAEAEAKAQAEAEKKAKAEATKKAKAQQSQKTEPSASPVCEKCGRVIGAYGKMNAAELADYTFQRYGQRLCSECAKNAARKAVEQ